MDPQVVGIVIGDLLDELVLDQVAVERSQIRRDLELLRPSPARPFARRSSDNVELQPALKHPAERFQNPALEVEIIFSSKISRRLGTPMTNPIIRFV